MPTTTRQQRHAAVLEAQDLIAGGLTPKLASLELIKRLGVSESTAYRYVEKAHAYWNHTRKRMDKGLRLSVALARAEKIMTMAKEAKRVVPTKEGFELADEPDFKTMLAAAQHEAKLLGLYAPEKHEVYVANFAKAMQLVVQLIAREVEDVALRGRLILGMRGIFEDAPKGKMLDSVSRETVIDAEIVPRETTNGST